MGWFKRLKEGIQTSTVNKRETPEGVWYNCKRCKETSRVKTVKDNFYKCPKCNYHIRIGSHDYFSLLFDVEEYTELFTDIMPKDALNFTDLKSYKERLEITQKQVGLTDAMAVAEGTIENRPIIIAAMDFAFIGGSMGSVVGEKIARAIDRCIEKRIPLLIISKSGGGAHDGGCFFFDANGKNRS